MNGVATNLLMDVDGHLHFLRDKSSYVIRHLCGELRKRTDTVRCEIY